jgi:hypothetical protein
MFTFHILILDDDQTVIERLKGRITPKVTIAGKTWNIDLKAVHVRTVLDDGIAIFCDDTLKQLIKSCVPPPNLILADYGYSTAEQQEALRDGRITPREYMDNILTPADLPRFVMDFLRTRHRTDWEGVRAGLLENPCKFVLYTFTPPKDSKDFPRVSERRIRTQRAFKSDVHAVDTLEMFYENERFADKHDKDFYAYLVTGLLENIIRRELLEFALNQETDRLKYIRYKRSAAGVLIIVLIGGAIGAVAEWLGHRIMDLFSNGLWGPAVAIVALASIVFFAVAMMIPFIFEKVMTNLLSRLKSENESHVLKEE